MALIYVAPTGVDTNNGLSEAAPKLTIAAGVAAAVAGDDVMVLSGVYNETVQVKAGVDLIGYGPTKPILDSNYTKQDAIWTNTAHNLTVQNFEITRYTRSGIRFQEPSNGDITNWQIRDNHIHHIKITGQGVQGAIFIVGGNPTITNNVVHDVGPGPEAEGCWLDGCHDSLVDGNIFYLCRKDGFRDYFGFNNTVRNNRAFACFCGLDFNEALAPTVVNNLVYDCNEGFNAKHTNDDLGAAGAGSGGFGGEGPMVKWGQDPATVKWAQFWHNTSVHNAWGDFVFGPNGPTTRQVDCRNNIFGLSGGADVWDTYTTAGGRTIDTCIVDYNVHVPGSFGVYHKGYTTSTTHYSTCADAFANVPGLQSDGTVGHWMEHSHDHIDPGFIDEPNGNYDVPANSPVTNMGVFIPQSPYGAQVGCRGLGPCPVPYTRLRGVTALSTSEPDAFRKTTANRLLNSIQWSYFQTTVNNVNVVFDLGTEKTLSHFVELVLNDGGSANLKGYIWESGTSPTGPWTVLLSGNVLDNQGANNIFEIPDPVSTRYVRFTMVNSWGTSPPVVPEVMFINAGNVIVTPPGGGGSGGGGTGGGTGGTPDPGNPGGSPGVPLIVPGGAYWGVRAA